MSANPGVERMQLGHAARKAGRAAEALDHYRSAVELEPGSAEAAERLRTDAVAAWARGRGGGAAAQGGCHRAGASGRAHEPRAMAHAAGEPGRGLAGRRGRRRRRAEPALGVGAARRTEGATAAFFRGGGPFRARSAIAAARPVAPLQARTGELRQRPSRRSGARSRRRAHARAGQHGDLPPASGPARGRGRLGGARARGRGLADRCTPGSCALARARQGAAAERLSAARDAEPPARLRARRPQRRVARPSMAACACTRSTTMPPRPRSRNPRSSTRRMPPCCRARRS